MAASDRTARLIFPHQLFEAHFEVTKGTVMVLVEDDLFFRQYRFHKQKLVLHRAAMREFGDALRGRGFAVEVIETSARASMEQLAEVLSRLEPSAVSYYELTDDWLEQRLAVVVEAAGVPARRLASPGFLTSLGQIDEYFERGPRRMQQFYEWQRLRLDVLVEGGRPIGGKWSFDTANRKKLPRTIELPPAYPNHKTAHVQEAIAWVEREFAANPGDAAAFRYPVTHAHAAQWLEQFVAERLSTFGPYEDAMSREAGEVFHSVLSPLLNCGLLTPRQVLDRVLDHAARHDVPIESLEGYVRQLIGWREYMRATYILFGRRMRTGNRLGFTRELSSGWWDTQVGLEPIDTVLRRVHTTAYAHHIERLMLFGNLMVLLRIHPDHAYQWFMEMFIDAYDWVMVPNVYAMSQFAAGELITTKPYISGSNYVMKMSDFAGGDWTETWDALYWSFINDHRALVASNHRMGMVVSLYDRMKAEKKERLAEAAKDWLD